MNNYIKRLMACGMTLSKAQSVYVDFITNFSLAELEVYVRYMESISNVG